ncbi:hypothetical protein FB451DRAFT_1273080 [Mycena latifolia]|nr:hypothetical protein FB451DRAFT_1273080 [Mycena latifolia]
MLPSRMTDRTSQRQRPRRAARAARHPTSSSRAPCRRRSRWPQCRYHCPKRIQSQGASGTTAPLLPILIPISILIIVIRTLTMMRAPSPRPHPPSASAPAHGALQEAQLHAHAMRAAHHHAGQVEEGAMDVEDEHAPEAGAGEVSAPAPHDPILDVEATRAPRAHGASVLAARRRAWHGDVDIEPLAGVATLRADAPPPPPRTRIRLFAR